MIYLIKGLKDLDLRKKIMELELQEVRTQVDRLSNKIDGVENDVMILLASNYAVMEMQAEILAQLKGRSKEDVLYHDTAEIFKRALRSIHRKRRARPGEKK